MKQLVSYFVSYAHDDRKLSEKLLKSLTHHFSACGDFEFRRWKDSEILIGENWHEKIQSAVRDCDFGLLLVSPAFLGSEYIGKHELPHFICGSKPCLPVALSPVDFDNHDLKGLDATQIFRFQSDGANTPRAFAEYTAANLQQGFALALFQQVTARLRKSHAVKAEVKSGISKRAANFTPNNLPCLQPFFGREKELADVARALDPVTRSWGKLIVGEGGYGKTALAIRAAYNCPVGQFDHIVFVSLKQQEQDDHRIRNLDSFAMSSWMQMLTEIARILNLSEFGKVPENERAKLLRDELVGRQVLLVLDNLESLSESEQDQLFTFLDRLPSGCKAILTSRTFAGNRVLAIDLPRLDQTSSLRMLAETADHNPLFAKSSEADRLRLYEQTRGIPLLLRWVAGQVGTGDCADIGDALAHLKACPSGNDPLTFIFGHVEQSLGDQEIALLAALTWPSQAIPITAIAEIANVPLTDAGRLLKFLANRSLVVPDREGEKYALIPMVAGFLRKHRPDEVSGTGRRLEQRAIELILENGHIKHDRFPVLDADWPTVVPALSLFLAGPNSRLHEACNGLFKFIEFTGRWDEGLTLNRMAEACALAHGDYVQAGWRAYHAGWFWYLRGQAAEVASCADRAREFWKIGQTGPREQSIAIRLRARAYQLTSEYPASLALCHESLELCREVSSESADMVIVLNAIAEIERIVNDHASAEIHYRDALRIARVVNYAEGVAFATTNLSSLALERGDLDNAANLAVESLTLSQRLGRQELIARSHLCLAKSLLNRQIIDALDHARLAVEIYCKLRSPFLLIAESALQECERALVRPITINLIERE